MIVTKMNRAYTYVLLLKNIKITLPICILDETIQEEGLFFILNVYLTFHKYHYTIMHCQLGY